MCRWAMCWPTIPGVPVYIQHDISAWTMAESLFDAPRGARDVIQVVIDHNVGAGVITDGRLLHAGSSSLVEIGHTQVDPLRQALLLRQPWLSGNHCQRRERAGAGADAHGQSMSSLLHQRPLSVEWLCQAALQGRSAGQRHYQRRG